MEIINYSSNLQELTMDELFLNDGGSWSWEAYGKATIGSAIAGGVAGGFAGSFAGGIGAGPGAVVGTLGGALGGAVTYCLVGWWW